MAFASIFKAPQLISPPRKSIKTNMLFCHNFRTLTFIWLCSLPRQQASLILSRHSSPSSGDASFEVLNPPHDLCFLSHSESHQEPSSITANSLQLNSIETITVSWQYWTHTRRTVWELFFRNAGHSLEIIMTSIAEMCCSKTEKDSHWTAVATLVFQEVSPMLGTHLWPKMRNTRL